MAEEQITERREQAVKRLQSLFDMHQIPFGAPEHLGGLLLGIHENRHFAMDFWSLVNLLSDSGSGTLSDAEMVEAVVESSAGVEASSLPADERPGVDELRQLLSGVDVSRPVELPKAIAQPVDALLSSSSAKKKAPAPSLLTSEEAIEKRRSIGETLAKLEESTRELRAQLAQLDAQMSSHSTAEPVLDEIKITEDQKSESLNKWNRMSPFGEGRIAAQDLDDEALQIASPMAEAAPPRRIAESHPSAKIPLADAVPSQPETQQTHKLVPVEPSATTRSPEPAPIAVFDPRSASTLGRRGLAIPDPDDDPRIKAPFSDYGAEEHSSLKRLVLPAIIFVLLAAGAFAGTRTEVGRVWLQRAVDSARDAYNSATGQKSETSAPTVEPPPPATQPATGEAAASSTSAASPSNSTSPQPAQPPQSLPAPAAEDRRPSGTPEDISRQRASQQMIGANVLRVPASTMAANLITSRVPAYPESARAQEIEGSVIMDVVISQTGTVKYVRVIDGDRHLRAAAQDAVLRWRYKPYLLNGEAVEVATTVKLDFHLPQ